MDLNTGEALWSQDMSGTASGDWSLSLAGDKLLLLSDSGKFGIAEASPVGYDDGGRPFMDVAENADQQKWYSPPVLVNDRLYFRGTAGSLICLTAARPKTDTDGDRLYDWKETDLYQTDPNDPDTDGDGRNDYVEICRGTDPTNALSFAAAVPLDFDGDSLADLAVRQADGKVRVLESSLSAQWVTTVGSSAWIPAFGDYDADGKMDYSWFIPSTTTWRIYPSTSNYAEQLPRITIGGAGDVPAPADYDGDYRTDPAVFRTGSGKLRIRYSSMGYTNLITTPMGVSTWLPAPADYDGDGKADYSWFIPATQIWRVYPSTSNYVEQLPRILIGGASDVPIAGADFDGDGKADIAVFRRANGKIRFIESSTGAQWTSGMGSATWLPAIGDYDGDGKADLSWFIPATQMWRVYESSNGNAERLPRVKFGAATDWPLATPLLGW
jgi:hypothetical protein